MQDDTKSVTPYDMPCSTGSAYVTNSYGALPHFTNRRWRGHAFYFIWLIYSAFFFVEPIQQNALRPWVEFGIAYAIFLALYSGIVFVHNARRQYLLLGGMTALSFAYLPLNAAAGGMCIYVAAILPFVTDSVWVCFGVISFLCGGSALESWYLHINPWSWGIIAFFCVAVGAGNYIASQARRSGMQLVRAHEQMAELAKVAERERIARDLHDLLGHTLSVVALKAELAGRFFDRDPARARVEIGEVETVAREALQQVREAVAGYRMRGLAAEVDNAQRSLASAGVKLTCMTHPPTLGPAEESVLALILREAITNVLRHARATEVRLEFSDAGDTIHLTVADNGRGDIRAEGSGLRGMRERVQMLGGSFHLDSSSGTTITVQLPAHAISGVVLQA